MAQNRWIGRAVKVAQVWTGEITAVDGTPANNTFTVTIGGFAITATGITSVGATAAALVALLNASTNPLFAAITWTNPSTGLVVGTADVAGCPFIAALSKAGAGTGTVTDFAATTASAGPNHYASAGNWSLGTAPVNTNDVVLEHSDVDICYDLDQSAVTLNSFTKCDSFTGRIGLVPEQFAKSADGHTTVDTDYKEYRDTVLKITLDASKYANLEQQDGPDAGDGSQMCRINFGTSDTPTIIVHKTARSSALFPRPAMHLLATHANAVIEVRSAEGGVGIADEAGDTSTASQIVVSGDDAHVVIGPAVTLATLTQSKGATVTRSAPTTLQLGGGNLTTEGDGTVTTATVRNATLVWNHIKTGGDAFTTITLNDGAVLDKTRSTLARTAGTMNKNSGSLYRYLSSGVVVEERAA